MRFKKTVFAFLIAFSVLSFRLIADCSYQVFNISTAPGTKISEFINQISDECSFSVIVKDEEAEKIMKKRLNKLNLKNATLNEVFDIILTENDLSYEIKNNILKISYLVTKTYKINYVTSKRTGESTTDASVDVGAQATSGGGGKKQTRDVNKIEAKDEFDFWKNTKEEIYNILNRKTIFN